MDGQFLEGNNLSKEYSGRKVVGGVNLKIKQGEIVGLLGPNGAGKTTTFYMMVGLVKADTGWIKIGDDNLTEKPLNQRALKGIGYLPQEASIFRELSVEDNLLSVLELRKYSNRQKRSSLEKLLSDFSLEHVRKSKGRELSGGERRRVEIARTLALGPKFVLLDEPFAGVDPLAVGDIHSIVKKLVNENIGVLITDHNVRETLNIVDRAYIMSKGKILIDGTPEELLASEVAREHYLGSDFKM